MNIILLSLLAIFCFIFFMPFFSYCVKFYLAEKNIDKYNNKLVHDKNENLDFYVNSTSKVPLFFVIGNCLFIQKGMNNIIKNFSIFYDDGLRIFEDIRFVNFEVVYF